MLEGYMSFTSTHIHTENKEESKKTYDIDVREVGGSTITPPERDDYRVPGMHVYKKKSTLQQNYGTNKNKLPVQFGARWAGAHGEHTQSAIIAQSRNK